MPPKRTPKINTVRKTVLMNPFLIKWPDITQNFENKIIQEFKLLSKTPLATKLKKTNNLVRMKMAGLIIGVNNVTKHLENGKLCSVIVCPTSKATQLNQHLIPLCETQNTPIVGLKLNIDLQKLFGLKSILALGILTTHKEQYLNLTKIIEDCAPKTVSKIKVELKDIPHPPDIEFPQIISERPEINKIESISFLGINSNLAFPEKDYPSELDSLQIKIIDPSMKFNMPTNKRKYIERNEDETRKQPKLLNLNLKQVIQIPNESKRKKKLLKKTLKNKSQD